MRRLGDEMNVQSSVEQAGRLIGNLTSQARAYLSGDSDIEEPTAGELWEKASPDLEKALAIYDKKESQDTPASTWIPLRTTTESCQKDIETILDTVLAVLGTCSAAGYRTRIRNLQADIATSQTRLGKYREQLLSAPAEKSQNFVEGLIFPSKEALKDQIADESDQITEKGHQIESLKVGFREHLKNIGINVPADIADSYLLPVEDNIISMAAVLSNIGRLTEQLQQLVDASKEAPAKTKRYYGMYVLLVFAVDRIQTHFVEEIDQNFLPKLSGYEADAAQHIESAQSQIPLGGPEEQLTANIAANRKTIGACRLMAETLQSHRRTVIDENRQVQILAAAAVNSYRTVCLSFNVAELIGYCESAFRALRELRLPLLRTFKSVQLNEEMQKLAERMVEKR
jgi:hypothetical protein